MDTSEGFARYTVAAMNIRDVTVREIEALTAQLAEIQRALSAVPHEDLEGILASSALFNGLGPQIAGARTRVQEFRARLEAAQAEAEKVVRAHEALLVAQARLFAERRRLQLIIECITKRDTATGLQTLAQCCPPSPVPDK